MMNFLKNWWNPKPLDTKETHRLKVYQSLLQINRKKRREAENLLKKVIETENISSKFALEIHEFLYGK